MASNDPLATSSLPGTGLEFFLFHDSSQGSTPWVVAIQADGEFWDAIYYADESDARATIADPLREERTSRPREKEPELDRSYIEIMTRVSRGRRVGSKPHAA